ncbi:MAG: VOC family protein [Nannocystaceae bacterium]
MPDDTVHKHHAIDYIEFGVADMAEAQCFYRAAFGWSFKDYGPTYAGIEGERKEMGGLCTSSELRNGGPLVVLYSKNLESSLAKVREAGGRIIKEPFSFPGGRRFHFADPSGNELAVWSFAAEIEAG